MATATSRALRAFLLVVCSAFMVSFSPSSLVSASSCAELLEWARPLAGTAPTLDEMGRYDRAHRRVLFSVLTPAVQAALWREQITRFSATPGLTATQRALAREGIALHTAALYEHDASARQAHAAFWQRAASAFSDPQSQRAWTDLGMSSSAAPVSAAPYCDCKLGGGTAQCGGTSCGGGTCTLVSGCGTSGLETCNGLCQ